MDPRLLNWLAGVVFGVVVLWVIGRLVIRRERQRESAWGRGPHAN